MTKDSDPTLLTRAPREGQGPSIAIHTLHLWVTHVSISGVYGPIATKFCVNVGLWTLMPGKIIEFGYHGNRCHGDQNTLSEFNNGHFDIEGAYG